MLAIDPDGQSVRRSLFLPPEDYQVALTAHIQRTSVSLWGILHRGRRIHRIENITNFQGFKAKS